MGLLRLFLALSVIAGHSQTTILGAGGIGAWYAVNFFFIISGFYMAMVLNEKYRDINPLKFYKSRALRLFPTYYVGLALAIAVSFGTIVANFQSLALWSKLYLIFQTVFIIGQDLSAMLCFDTVSGGCTAPLNMVLNPPAWSLAVELAFYLVAPFILKSVRRTFAFFMLGCAYLILVGGLKFPFSTDGLLNTVSVETFNYNYYPASIIFFGAGALAYHLSRGAKPNYWLAVGALVALSFTKTVMPFWHILFIGLAIPVLFKYTASNKVDRFLGELSYPSYILHFPLVLLLRPYSDSNMFGPVSLGTVVALLACGLGIIVYYLVDRPIDNYRHSKRFLSAPDVKQAPAPLWLSKAVLIPYLIFPVCVLSYMYVAQHTRPVDVPYNLSDTNWLNGIGRKDASFFVAYTKPSRKAYAPGQFVRFENGEVRQVVGAVRKGEFLNIELSGDPLDGEAVGYPHKIKVLKRQYVGGS